MVVLDFIDLITYEVLTIFDCCGEASGSFGSAVFTVVENKMNNVFAVFQVLHAGC